MKFFLHSKDFFYLKFSENTLKVLLPDFRRKTPQKKIWNSELYLKILSNKYGNCLFVEKNFGKFLFSNHIWKKKFQFYFYVNFKFCLAIQVKKFQQKYCLIFFLKRSWRSFSGFFFRKNFLFTLVKPNKILKILFVLFPFLAQLN